MSDRFRQAIGLPTQERTRRLGVAALFVGEANSAAIMDKLAEMDERLRSIEAALDTLTGRVP